MKKKTEPSFTVDDVIGAIDEGNIELAAYMAIMRGEGEFDTLVGAAFTDSHSAMLDPITGSGIPTVPYWYGSKAAKVPKVPTGDMLTDNVKCVISSKTNDAYKRTVAREKAANFKRKFLSMFK